MKFWGQKRGWKWDATSLPIRVWNIIGPILLAVGATATSLPIRVWNWYEPVLSSGRGNSH